MSHDAWMMILGGVIFALGDLAATAIREMRRKG